MATASPGSSGFDSVIRSTEAKFKRCPDTRKKFTRAAQAAAFDIAQERPDAPSWGLAPLVVVLGAVAVVVMLALTSGCVPMEAVEQAREEHAISIGHALDPALPIEARQIGADGARAWAAQHRSLTGDDLPIEALSPELAPVTPGGE
jgi:hypothetical protein